MGKIKIIIFLLDQLDGLLLLSRVNGMWRRPAAITMDQGLRSNFLEALFNSLHLASAELERRYNLTAAIENMRKRAHRYAKKLRRFAWAHHVFHAHYFALTRTYANT